MCDRERWKSCRRTLRSCKASGIGRFATRKLRSYRQMYASYTGDKHGRWDICRVRIFKLMEDKTLRILTMMEGLEESIDQRVGKSHPPDQQKKLADLCQHM